MFCLIRDRGVLPLLSLILLAPYSELTSPRHHQSPFFLAVQKFPSLLCPDQCCYGKQIFTTLQAICSFRQDLWGDAEMFRDPFWNPMWTVTCLFVTCSRDRNNHRVLCR